MSTQVLRIKNMVCDRCILAVKQTFAQLTIPVVSVSLGEVVTDDIVDEQTYKKLHVLLQELGFELLEDRKRQLVERIKNILIEQIHQSTDFLHINLSDYLSEQLKTDYRTLSKYFSEFEHQTLEHFVIVQKIERVKELLSYNELTLSQIADSLNYSSVAHLSNQFKKIMGITPSEYKNQAMKTRIPLDEL